MDEPRLYAALEDINIRLTAHTTILNEVLKPQIDKIEKHLDVQNGRVAKLEKRVDERDIICGNIQESKKNSVIRTRWIVTSIIAVGGLIIAALKVFPNKETHVVYVPITDSIVRITPIKIRNGNRVVDSVSIHYFDVMDKNLKR